MVSKARVPLVKLKMKDSGIEVDISIDSTGGLKQVQYIDKVLKLYPEFKYLYLVFKCFLKIRDLSETYRGGVGSFLLFCLLHIYLQETQRK